MDTKGLVRNRSTIRKCHGHTVGIEHQTSQTKSIEIVECTMYRTLLRQLRFPNFTPLQPLVVQSDTIFDVGLRQRLGVPLMTSNKVVQMVAFGLILSALQLRQILGAIDVVRQRPRSIEGELRRVVFLQKLAPLRRQTIQSQRRAQSKGILSQKLQNHSLIATAHGLHIGLCTAIIEADNQKALNLSNLAMVGVAPTEDVCEIEVTVLLLRPQHIILEQWLVGHCYGMKIYMVFMLH